MFTRADESNSSQEELLLPLFNSPPAVKRTTAPLKCCRGLLTHPLGVVEVAFHHFTGFAITTADSTAILFGSWANDSIAANFLMTTTRGPHYFVCKVKVSLNIVLKTKRDICLKTWTGRGPRGSLICNGVVLVIQQPLSLTVRARTLIQKI